jgi:pilus assembly protein TadC
VSVPEKLLGAGALIMALCCALLPVAGAALGGGLIAGAGTIGVVTGVMVLAAALAIVTRRRARRRC